MNAIYALVAAGVLLVTSGHLTLPAFLQRKPPTQQLARTELDLQQARAAQASAEAKLGQLEATRDSIREKQLDYTQQMTELTLVAVSNIPGINDIPEGRIAHEAAVRAVAGFEAARGSLSPEVKAQISALYDKAMAAKNAELETLRRELAKTDSERASEAARRTAAEAQIPSIRADVAVAQAKTATVEAKATTLERQVVDYATKQAAVRAEAGSWQAYFWTAIRVLVGLTLLYLVIHVFLPSWGQSYPGGLTEKIANFFKNLTTTHN